ncbi:DUF262 domain-containing protein [Chryseobacterium arthrosphaerae]|uniref:DUF262 domain-containing protein n=1 Tax=Chryseobacterium arthrosphaerae TaxID=651561 RepID=UPI003D33E663
MNILNRNSTTINIANFWENYQLGKYNFEPSYQRKSDVWSESKKSFLIDTILKNFPIPPIFLHQHISPDTGKTMYDVIDGKQRLGSILAFINNEITTPDDFHSDGFGSIELSGITFQDLDDNSLTEWKKAFWRYDITIEYIDTDKVEIVNNIFDRLNRNGEPLTKQELRNAKYHNTPFYGLIHKLSKEPSLSPILDKLQRNRLEDEEYITELLISSISNSTVAGDKPEVIDDEMERLSKSTIEDIYEYENAFKKSLIFLDNLNLNYKKLRIDGVSHFYALWGVSIELLKTTEVQDIDYINLKDKLEGFYEKYLSKSDDPSTKEYRITMSAGTKGFGRRQKRIQTLLEYCSTNY